ncbi:MAG TPA: hypothetical protein VGK67_33275 [Myxococcales bacterium]
MLALLASALLLLCGTGCCWFSNNLVNTGDGVDLYGEFEFAGGVQPSTDLVVAVVAPCAKKEHCYDVNTVEKDSLSGGWHYGVIVPPGDYELLVFADRSGDGKINRNDLVGRAPVHVPKGAEAAGMVEGPALKVDLANPTDAGFHVDLKERHVPTLWPSLRDRFFDKKWGLRGLVWPAWGLRHTDNEFLFGLGADSEPRPAEKDRRARLAKRLAKKVNASKVQVLFVHGVQDTPLGFDALSQLDPARYQPWFFFYPSGLGLAQLGEELAMVVETLAEKADTLLVAHSMGGLVSRQALKNLAAGNPAKFPLKGYVSLGTPYGGMDSANGMNNIPVSLRPYVKRQSLFDVQPEGPFIAELYQGAYPEGLPFYLFWGNARGDGDGTVSKASATDPRAASRAVDVCDYYLDHVGMLANGNEPPVAGLRGDFQLALDNLASGKPGLICSDKAAKP